MSADNPQTNPQPGLNAALDNLDPEWQQLCARMGVEILLITFDGRPGSKLYSSNAAWEQIGEALLREGFGIYANSTLQGGLWLSFFQIFNLARGVNTVKAELLRLDLLDCAQMLVCEPGQQKWQQYWPATAEEVSTK